jgi:hypothetical protein
MHSGPPNNITMRYATEEDAVASFTHPILTTVQGEPDYQTIHHARAIDTHLGGGALGRLGLIVSDARYALAAPTGANRPVLWVNPTSPG